MATFKHVDFEVPAWGELSSGSSVWRSYANAVLDLNPVAYWRLGETGGATAHDATAQHDGTYAGGVTLDEPGAILRDADSAAAFDGSSGYVNVPHDASLNLGRGDSATWLMWALKDAPANETKRWLLGKGLPGPDELRYLIELDGADGTIQFATNNGNWHAVTSNTGLAFDGWRHIAVTWDGANTMTFFHDGQSVGSAAFNASWFPSNAADLTLGAAHASIFSSDLFHFAGRLDDVALFDQALTADQIRDLYNRGVGHLDLS